VQTNCAEVRVEPLFSALFCDHYHVSATVMMRLNVTSVRQDIHSIGTSRLDFVEKLIHRFDEDQETCACDLKSGATVEHFRSIVRERRQIGRSSIDNHPPADASVPPLAQRHDAASALRPAAKAG
jgi:hypothetical protein